MESVTFADPVEEEGDVAIALVETTVDTFPTADEQERVGGYRVHAAAAVFATQDGEAFEALVAAIAENGQREPVTVSGDLLVEGVDTVRAVVELQSRGVDIQLQTVQWMPPQGQTVAEFVAYKNLHGPRLTDAQRAQYAADLVPLIEQERAEVQQAARIKPGEVRNPGGINQHTASSKANANSIPASDKKARNKAKVERSTVGRIAALAKVTPYAAGQAVKIKQKASLEVIEAVKAGQKKPKDVLAEIGPGDKATRATKAAKPIEHPYAPSDDFERDLLRCWIRTVEQNAGIADKARARSVYRSIFKAEEAAERAVLATASGAA